MAAGAVTGSYSVQSGGSTGSDSIRTGGVTGSDAIRTGGVTGSDAIRTGGVTGSDAIRTGGLTGSDAIRSGGLTGSDAIRTGGVTGSDAIRTGGVAAVDADAPPLRWLDIVRLGTVQAALGAVVVLVTSTLNRVMVVEYALPALLPGMLVAMHYAVQMIRPRFGHGSDRGGRRTPWIIGGMAVLAGGGVLGSVATTLMGNYFALGLTLAVTAYAVVGVGVGAAGTSLLVLMAKRVDDRRRAAAATIMWILMIAGFAVTSTAVGHFLDPFSPQRLIVVASVAAAAAFLIGLAAIWRVETPRRPPLATGGYAPWAPRRTCESGRHAPVSAGHDGRQVLVSAGQDGRQVLVSTGQDGRQVLVSTGQDGRQALAPVGESGWQALASTGQDGRQALAPVGESGRQALASTGEDSRQAPHEASFRVAMRKVWCDPQARGFTLFVFVSMLAYSAQELLLEPFCGLVFGYSPGESAKLSGTWHAAALVGMISTGILCRGGRRFGSLRTWTIGGCCASAAALVSLAGASVLGPGWPLRPSVVLLGVANGVFTVSAIGSMMELAHRGDARTAGVRMGLWGAAQAIAFALGGVVGSGIVDSFRWRGSPITAFAVVFSIEAVMFFAAAILAARTDSTDSNDLTEQRLSASNATAVIA